MRCNKILAVAVMLCGIFFFCATVHAANLLSNPSFETASPTGWAPGFTQCNHPDYYAGYAPAGCGSKYGAAWGQDGGWGTWGSSSQTVGVSGSVGNSYVFSAWLSAYTPQNDYAEVRLEFFNSSSGSLGSFFFDGNNGSSSYIVGSANSSGVADPSVAWTLHNWTLYEVSGIVPSGAVNAVVTLSSNSVSGNANDSYIDLVNLDIATGPSVVIEETGADTSVKEGEYSDSYNLSLGYEPSADVQITVTPGDGQIDLGSGAGVAITVDFTSGPSGDWATPKPVNVSAYDDSVYEGKTPHTTTITHSAVGGDYTGISISSLDVDVIDDEETCGDWGYLVTDLNRDCYVTILDLVEFIEAWLDSGGI